jgi:glycerol-3-phosphate dehydrogenase
LDAKHIQGMVQDHPELGTRIHANLPYIQAEIVWAVRQEMSRTIEDALSRRTRALLLDAKAALEAAPLVASLMAKELGRDEAWQQAQQDAFRALAKASLLS